MTLDAIVIGAGPNGLAAAITLARAGRSVRVYEQAPTIGGSTRSEALTLPGYVHDVCATVHSLVLASPFLKTLPLAEFGLELVHPQAPFGHPMDDGSALVVQRSVDATADAMTRHDGVRYRRLLAPFVERADDLMHALLGPLGLRHPLLMARFGLRAIQSAEGVDASNVRERSNARDVRRRGGTQHGSARSILDGGICSRTPCGSTCSRMAGGTWRITTAERRHGRVSPLARRRDTDVVRSAVAG